MAAWLTPYEPVTLPNPHMEVLFICFPFVYQSGTSQVRSAPPSRILKIAI